jgi:hypothetical protein
MTSITVARNIKLIDTHVHCVDFLQHSEGLSWLLRQMDKAGIEKAVIFGLPVKKKWAVHDKRKPSYYLDGYSTCFYFTLTDELLAQEYLNLNKSDQKRFAPLICGFNPTDVSSLDYLEFIYHKYPIWKGIGELLLRHDELSILTTDELARVNHQALDKVFSFCAQKNIPALIHHNCCSIGFGNDFTYVYELEEVLEKYPRLKFIWAHCGASRRTTNGRYHEMMERLLLKYPNLYADISWVVYEEEICKHGEPKKEWIQLFTRYSERFTIGSDIFGHFDELKSLVERYHLLLEKLPDKAAQNLAWMNAEKLWFNSS